MEDFPDCELRELDGLLGDRSLVQEGDERFDVGWVKRLHFPDSRELCVSAPQRETSIWLRPTAAP